MKRYWLDSRVTEPSSNNHEIYDVCALYCGIVMVGRASWMPDGGYKTGRWQELHTHTGNKLSDFTVLYWKENIYRPPIKAVRRRWKAPE